MAAARPTRSPPSPGRRVACRYSPPSASAKSTTLICRCSKFPTTYRALRSSGTRRRTPPMDRRLRASVDQPPEEVEDHHQQRGVEEQPDPARQVRARPGQQRERHAEEAEERGPRVDPRAARPGRGGRRRARRRRRGGSRRSRRPAGPRPGSRRRARPRAAPGPTGLFARTGMSRLIRVQSGRDTGVPPTRRRRAAPRARPRPLPPRPGPRDPPASPRGPLRARGARDAARAAPGSSRISSARSTRTSPRSTSGPPRPSAGSTAGRIAETTARLPAAAAAIAGVLLVARLGADLFGGRAGVLAGCVLATSNLFFWYARQGHPDQFLTAFVTLAGLGLWRTLARAGPRDAWAWTGLAYAAMALGVLSKGLLGLVIPLLAAVVYAALTGPLRALPARLRLAPGLGNLPGPGAGLVRAGRPPLRLRVLLRDARPPAHGPLRADVVARRALVLLLRRVSLGVLPVGALPARGARAGVANRPGPAGSRASGPPSSRSPGSSPASCCSASPPESVAPTSCPSIRPPRSSSAGSGTAPSRSARASAGSASRWRS